MSANDWNPLSSFKELGTLSKILLLVGFAFLAAVLAALVKGVALPGRMLPASLALIALSSAVHYFSQSRPASNDPPYHVITDKRNMALGTVMAAVTAVLFAWAVLAPTQRQSVTSTPESTSSGPAPSRLTVAISTEPNSIGTTVRPQSTPKEPKNVSNGNGTHAAGDNSAAIGTVTQGPCSVLQAGGNNNQATGGNCGPPERHLTDSQADKLAKAAALVPATQQIIVEECNMPECQRYGDAVYAALKRNSPSSLVPGPNIALIGWDGGPQPRGPLICLQSGDAPTKAYAQPIADALNEEKAVKVDFTRCAGLKENEIKIIIAAP